MIRRTAGRGAGRALPAEARQVRRLLRGTAWQVRGPLLTAVLGAVARQAGFLAAPYLLSVAVDDGVVAGDAGAVAFWCAALAVAALLQFAGMCVWDQGANLADARAGSVLRARVREGAIHGADGLETGDLLVRAGRDVGLVRVWVHGLPTWAVIAVTAAVLVLGLAALDVWLLLVAGATAPCLAVLSVVYPRRFERASRAAADAHGSRANVVDQIVRAARGLRGVGAEDAIIRRHDAASAELAERTVRASGVLARWTALGEGVPAVAASVGVLVGAVAVLDGRLTVGGLVAFTGWMATVGVAVQVGLMRWTQSVDARVGAARLAPVIARAPARPAGAATPARRVARVEARALVPVPGASAVDVTLTPGRLVVVTGGIASGKSMLLRVLAGLVAPAGGALLADGSPVRAPLSGAHLVPQRPVVLTGTVRDNLALGAASGDATADDARYRQALAGVGLDVDLAGRAPDLLDLEVGEDGGALSGGQRQRLALARGLVAEPALLLLDDVTSAADGHTAARLVAAMRRAARERIVVAAGHDDLLLAAADEVVVLRDRATVPA
ncbi:ABC transporter ATP-binding protein [Cellulomonas cellasea]|uniref:ATP-binding cassette domain-containing protein n=1 Tax=Cellulomonas cellasea TaxID=43670 RepID=UPI0025A3516F|nr:ABC transporter ATP-binding protein [Cellulomonas cellasea]MDM8083675.1 ABC transporter ATP-binding protein [Cellulomonas cellasea]